jgi:hypothetical protein
MSSSVEVALAVLPVGCKPTAAFAPWCMAVEAAANRAMEASEKCNLTYNDGK